MTAIPQVETDERIRIKDTQAQKVRRRDVSSGQTEQLSKGEDPGRLRYLASDEFAAWDKLVDISPQGSPFYRSWWLKAVGGTVSILGYYKGGSLIAGIPLYCEKRYGMNIYTMPKLTQTLGPVLAPSAGKPVAALWREMEVLSAFAKEVAKFPIFFQAFHPSLHNWSPFYWNGFTQTSRATQVVDLRPADKIWECMAKGARRHIHRAEGLGITIEPCGPEPLWQAEHKSFSRQGMKVPHSVEYLGSLYDAAKANDAGEIFAAYDGQRRMHCACFIIWDRNRAYTVASGADPELRDSGAHSLMTWHLAQIAAEKSPVLDFAGSMLQPVELFLRSFGAAQVPYNWVMKFPLWLKMYLVARRKI